jgi:hypothetical protein
MEIITIKTLVDITNSGINRPKMGAEKEFNQHRNWTTLLQCIGLRSIINYDSKPACDQDDIKNLGFGKKYKGKHKIWTFTFTTDRSSSYFEEDNPIGLLIKDLDQVPVLKNCDETINMSKAVFDLLDDSSRNTIVEISIADPEK